MLKELNDLSEELMQENVIVKWFIWALVACTAIFWGPPYLFYVMFTFKQED